MTAHQPGMTVKLWRCLFKAQVSILLVLLTVQPSAAVEPVLDFGSNPGELRMFLHRPSGFTADLPLVVALHGCTQTAIDFGNNAGLVSLAEEVPFLLLLPEQRKANMSRRCFRWYDEDDNQPGSGESASILEMINFVIETEGVDHDRVFVLGLSAGGAMTAALLANYPDRIAGGAIFAGLPFGCNRPNGIFDVFWNWLHLNPFAVDGADASYACGVAGFSLTDRDAAEWAGYVTESAAVTPDRWPVISIWQGTGDATVDPDNLLELTEQWTGTQGIDTVPEESQRAQGSLHNTYHDEAGNALVETWSIDDFGHGLPIDADGDPDVCGRESEFILEAKSCALRRVAEFWQLQ